MFNRIRKKKLNNFVDKSAKIHSSSIIWEYTRIRENVLIGSNCNIGRNVYIGPGVVIGENVKIQNNVLILLLCHLMFFIISFTKSIIFI